MGRRKSAAYSGKAGISKAVAELCSLADFRAVEIPLPEKKGTQLSMTGETSAFANSGAFDETRLHDHLASCPSVRYRSGDDIDDYISRGRFILMCCRLDRALAVYASVTELTRAGITKIIVAADTPAERDRLAEALSLMKDSLGARVGVYRPGEYDEETVYMFSAAVYAFLTSAEPEILVLGRDCISKRTNLVNKSGEGDSSLASLLAIAHPACLVSCDKVSGGRSLSKTCRVFEPVLTLVFCGEDKKPRDAVIYEPCEPGEKSGAKSSAKAPVQMSFE